MKSEHLSEQNKRTYSRMSYPQTGHKSQEVKSNDKAKTLNVF
ncbi:MAG: hypothetical protein ACM3P0_09470 [Acidobacteriota bacterium]